MPVTQLDEATWTKIIHPALVPVLNKAGMSRTFPRHVFYGPSLYQGFGFIHPYLLQEFSHIATLFQESVRSSQTGRILRLTAESLRLELGIPLHLGVTPYHPFASYVTPCWYKHVWKFFSVHPVSLFEDFPQFARSAFCPTFRCSSTKNT